MRFKAFRMDRRCDRPTHRDPDSECFCVTTPGQVARREGLLLVLPPGNVSRIPEPCPWQVTPS